MLIKNTFKLQKKSSHHRCHFFLFYLSCRDFQSSIANLLEDIEAERVKHAKNPMKIRQMTSIDRKYSIEKSVPRKKIEKPRKTREPDINPVVHPKLSIPSISSLSDDTKNTISTNLSGFNTNSSVSTLKTYDNIEFQNDLIHLETKIDVVKDALQSQQKHLQHK